VLRLGFANPILSLAPLEACSGACEGEIGAPVGEVGRAFFMRD
jgi:hypothetical protein